MSVKRKCIKCGTWNGAEDNCFQCGTVISPVIIEEQREVEREKRRLKPPSKFDLFLENWKNSRFLALRILYHVLYTIAFIFFSIASFFAWLAATPNG